MHAYATHYPILAGVIAKTAGDILELGVGHYSTPLVSFMAKASGRMVVSVDINQEWLKFFSKKFRSINHQYVYTDDNLISTYFLQSPDWRNKKWGVAFIDCRPEYDRVACLKLLRSNCDYIVAHDTEPQTQVYNWDKIFDSFPNKYYYSFYGNGTTVVSMTEDCSWLS